jgi:DNA helicase-2/ATP-dependent DNA helicase PcrA
VTQEIRIYGPPGTGKTTKLINEVIPEAVAKHGAERVILCSFTKAAARELASRLDIFSLPITEDADPSVEGIRATTLHALCFSALGKPKLATQYMSKWNEENPHYCITSEGGGSGDAVEQRISGSGDLLSQCNILRNRLIDPRTDPTLQDFYTKWCDWKTSRKILDFTDLIEQCIDRIFTPPGGATCIIVDEAQDCTPLQLKLIRFWAIQMQEIILALDDDQVLYGWSGVDPQLLVIDKEDKTIQKIVLSKSYRLPEQIWSYANAFIKQIKTREPKVFTHNGEVGEIVRVGYNYTNASNIVDLLLHYSTKGSVMVMGSCAYMVKPACDIMKERGIPFSNPYRATDKAWNPCETKGFKLIQSIRDGEGFHVWGEFISKKFFKKDRTKKELEHELDILYNRFQTEDINLKAASFDLMNDFLHDDILEQLDSVWEDKAARVEWFTEHILDSERKKLTYALAYEASHEKPTHPIYVGSIHSFKGGEAAHTLIFPDLSYAAYQEYCADIDSFIRLFYVAVTRAKQTLILAKPAGRHFITL